MPHLFAWFIVSRVLGVALVLLGVELLFHRRDPLVEDWELWARELQDMSR